jgi:hypothetical protein
MWLRDSLPYDLEGVRVLTYGYDTSLVGSQTFQNIDDIAISLNKGIRRIRRDVNVSGLREFFFVFFVFHWEAHCDRTTAYHGLSSSYPTALVELS